MSLYRLSFAKRQMQFASNSDEQGVSPAVSSGVEKPVEQRGPPILEIDFPLESAL